MADQPLVPICPECGRPRVGGGHGAGPVTAVTAEAAAPEPSRRSLVVVVALLLAALAGLLVFVPDRTDEQPSPDEQVLPISTPPPVSSLPTPESTPVPLDLTLGAGQRVAYASDEGLVIVETRSGAVDLARISLTDPEVAYVDPFVLVSDDRRTWAVHPAATAEPFVLASNYRLVATAEPEQYVFIRAERSIDDADEVFVGQASDGSFGPSIPLPPGSRRLAASGVGLLVVPAGGATYEVRFGGLEPFSDGTVIAAAGTHRLEVRCNDGLSCRTSVVDGRTGVGVPIAEQLVGRLAAPALSADGRRVAGRDGDAVLVVDLASRSVEEIALDDTVLALAWDPDGDVLTVLVGPREDASIVVVDMNALAESGDADVDPLVVGLRAVGAPAPVGSGLVAF